MTVPVVETQDLAKTYHSPSGRTVAALRSVSLTVARGERLVVMGRSGAGKSTLLNLLGLLDEPTSGEYMLLGRSVGSLRERERDAMRREAIGFVFQSYHVLGNLSVWQNVNLKLSIAGAPPGGRRQKIAQALAAVGLGPLSGALTRDLSGGEKQRLAIARALVNSPALVLADEPTGNLDKDNADAVLGLLSAMAAEQIAVVVISHDERTATWADRVMTIEDGFVRSGP